MTEIILLALVALFVGLRLFAVLGRRTGHEQQPILRPAESATAPDAGAPAAEAVAGRPESSGFVYEEPATPGIRAIVAADPSFDVARFLEGAQAAYRVILEAFWKGDREELRHLVGGDVLATFEQSITERESAGHKLENRLIAIERAVIQDARLSGRTAEIDVRFDADVSAVTRDRDGNMIAGTLSDAVGTHDVWTFRRTLSSGDPNWLLVETDEAD
ncbi:MAG TPA: Tim44/TimA family putative adaptor protein [Allosphingosinicella sp.]|nr:Tim44/TimA family putative adaptor protein [Allosphingosinicella sp.]